MIRWKGLIFIAGLAALIFLLGLFFTDRWLERQLEEAGGTAVGAKVEIDGLDFSFIPTKLKWQRLQVTNPRQTMENLFETGECLIKIRFWPLLTRHLMIDHIKISNLRLHTPRQTDGKIEKPAQPKTDGFINRSLTKLKDESRAYSLQRLANIKQKVNMDSLLKRLPLQSPQKIDSLKKLSQKRYDEWTNKLKTLKERQDMAVIREALQKVEPKKIKKLDQLLKALDKIKKADRAAKNLQKTWRDVTVNFNKDLTLLRQSYQSVDNWIAADLAAAKRLARLPNISTKNISRFLFGRKIVNQISQYLSYLSTARYYAHKYQAIKPDKEEKPPRFKGQDIHLYGPGARPDFWVHRIYLSGQTNDSLTFVGKVTNLVSNQKLIDKPTRIDISGQSGQRSMDLSALFDYRNDIPKETFRFNYMNFPIKDYAVIKSSALTLKINKGIGSAQSAFNLAGNKINGEIVFNMRNMKLAKVSQRPAIVYRLIAKALNDTPKWNIKARISGRLNAPQLSMRSNLDELLAKQLRRQVGRELQQQERLIRQKIDRTVQPRLKELAVWRKKQETTLQDQITQYDRQIQEQLKKVAYRKKQIEQRIKKEKGRLGKGALKKLKGLF